MPKYPKKTKQMKKDRQKRIPGMIAGSARNPIKPIRERLRVLMAEDDVRLPPKNFSQRRTYPIFLLKKFAQEETYPDLSAGGMNAAPPAIVSTSVLSTLACW